jgi:hypothetical protein
MTKLLMGLEEGSVVFGVARPFIRGKATPVQRTLLTVPGGPRQPS